MSFRAAVVVGSSVVLLSLAACGGNVNTFGADGGGVGGGSEGGGGGGGGEGGAGEGGGGGGGSCTTATLPGDRACVPGVARANTPLEIDIDASEGCLGCFTTFEPCQVVVSGTTITVSMVTKSCPPAGDQACPAVCLLPQTSCKLPALAAGTYTVDVTGQPTSTGLAPRTLVVADDATATSCKLPRNGEKPAPLDGSKYSTSCSTDDDCMIATAGELCGPCKCPNLAIAKASSSAYGADYRERTSQCQPEKSGVQCAACPPAKAACEIQPNALTGTCKVVPGF
jgi:hypothetical protein